MIKLSTKKECSAKWLPSKIKKQKY